MMPEQLSFAFIGEPEPAAPRPSSAFPDAKERPFRTALRCRDCQALPR